jgi:DNA-binding MarR family transcriptional regulator
VTTSVSSYRSPSLDAAAAVADGCSKLMRGFGRVRSQLLALARGDVDWSAQLLITRLAADGPVRLSELAEKVQADPSTISRQIATLVKEGYVERRADPVDGRASLLVITDRGAQIYTEHLRLRTEHYQRMLADWSEDDCRTFATLTARFSESIRRSEATWFDRPTVRPSSMTPSVVAAAGNA